MTDGFICCTVGSRQFAFRAVDVRHVSRLETMRPGAAADGRVGALSINGQSVPVFSLDRVLGEAPAAAAPPSGDQHIAVTGGPGELVGWLVDRISRIGVSTTTSMASLPDLTGTPATTWFDALVDFGDTSVLLLAPQYLNPLAGRAAARDAAAFHAPPMPIDRHAESMAVFFSTSALPRCDAQLYAISARQIAAIVQPLPLTTVPGCASYVSGVSRWRNSVVPVIDFRDRADRAGVAHGRWLLAQCGGRLRGTLVAFPIDDAISVHQPAAGDQRLAAPPCPAFAAGMFRVGGNTVALLDLDALFLTAN